MKITITAPDKASLRKVFDRIIELNEIGGKAKLITRDGYSITSKAENEISIRVLSKKETVISFSDICVACGRYAPEGSWVCSECSKGNTRKEKV